MLVLSLLSSAYAATCPAPVGLPDLRAEIAAAESAASAHDRVGFTSTWGSIVVDLGCLDRPLTREDAARYHALSALDAELRDDARAAVDGFRAAIAALPSARRPGWLGPSGTVIDGRYRAALASGSDPRQPLAVPEGVLLVVDGLEAQARPTSRPALYQAVALDGTVEWTLLLAGDAGLPAPIGVAPVPSPTTTAAVASGGEPLTGLPAEPEELLAIATEALAAGDHEKALRVALPAISDHPRFQRSFRAVADLAADQAARQATRPSAAPTYAPPAYPYRPPKPPSEFKFGFDVGLPTGVRVEWKLHGRAVDSLGLRLGANLLVYDGVFPAPDQTFYLDANLPGDWQLEVGVGLMTYRGWAYPQAGLAVQWDPDTPIQAQFGARIAGYGVMPEASLSFLW